jgi:hypothetical protein
MLSDAIAREHLPLPDRPFAGFGTYDAKDPETTDEAAQA